MKQKFAIYSDNINKNTYIAIKNYLSKKYSYYDCVIFSDSFLDKAIDATIVSSFYLRFFVGSVIFTNIEDYIYYKDLIISNSIFLITTPDLLRNNGLADYKKYSLTILNIEKEDIYEI
jgi:hypothetical protein